VENTEAVTSAPVETGQAGGSEVGQATETSTPSYEYVNVDEIGDRYVKVKIDGEELDVPVKEALSGYQRQADYTRKTQELAAQRESLQYAATLAEALQTDPAGTLQLLSQHYGAPTSANQPTEDLELMDPIERQVYELNQKVQQFEQMQAKQELEQEIGRLSSKYQDFNAPEVINHALRTGIVDLELAYKQVAYDRLAQEVAAIRGAQQVVASKEQQIVDAKRDASFVTGGVSANGATEPVGRISSVADAWLAAKRQMGM
jgi:hypothetical protein